MRFGLFGSGAVSASFLARLPGLATHLGPVASLSYRLASRIVNSLRAGSAVRDPAELDSCEVLLMSVPKNALASAGARLAAAGVLRPGKVLVVCGDAPCGAALEGFRTHGAAAGSLWPVSARGRYAAEGDRAALSVARRLVRAMHGKLTVLTRPGLGLYGAGTSFATGLFTPLIAASLDSLRKAGFSRRVALELSKDLFQRTLRAWQHSGRKSWSGPLADGDLTEIHQHLEALCRHDPRAARFYRHSAAFALEYFQRHAELLRQL